MEIQQQTSRLARRARIGATLGFDPSRCRRWQRSQPVLE